MHSLTRTKLPLESGIRNFSGIKELLAVAEESRGKQIELQWTTGKPGQSFVLDVQWDASSDDPVWSLYEENDEGSKKLWSQSFATADLQLFYDVLVMSCGAPPANQNLADILKPKTPEGKDEQSTPIKEDTKVSKPQPEVKEDKPSNSNSTDKDLPAYNNINQQAIQPPPQQNMPGGMPFAQSPYPNYNIPPGAFPMPYPPMMSPPPGYMPPPVMQPGWTYGPIPPDNTGHMMPGLPSNPYSPIPAPAPSNTQPLTALPVDNTLLDKRYEISLNDLLRKANLINETSLDAALKIQSLIQEQKISLPEGIKTLKQHHQKGDLIEACIGAPLKNQESIKKEPIPIGKAKPMSKEKSAAFDLLEQAGLLNKDDINTAKNVSRKHGGDLVAILKAAQKLDDKTFEAALICVSLIGEDLMKLEQCVIALNYCSRSRVGFDEAIEELGWPNPRKKH